MRHAVVLVLALASLTHAAEPTWEKDARPFLEKYCFECHGAKQKKGNLRLHKYESAIMAAKEPEVWAKVAERTKQQEMPPEGAKQPTPEERAMVVGWSERTAKPPKIDNCKQLETDQNTNFYKGHAMSRRLTRAEYANTLRDLLGVESPAERLPTDGAGGEGFDTNGDTLYLSGIQLEKYLDVAARSLAMAKLPAVANRDAAKTELDRFARRAYRRPVEAEEVERLLAPYDRATARGDRPADALRLALKGVLISPHFLFLVEPQSDVEGVFPLPPFALASRLSYFLWASCPDEELLALAGSGALSKDDVLRAQARRMLRDPKARALGESFGLQWLNLTALGGAMRPDLRKFPDCDDELLKAMREEIVRTVTAIFAEDRSILELLDADTALVNDRLARHYGLDGVTGPKWRRVSLSDRNRGGLVGTAAVLTGTSFPLRTSPVLRGKWVLEDLLGSKVPPPPPGAGELPKDDKPGESLTLRQQLEAHRAKAECASCHARMDPLGFGLENFDAIGRWRTHDAGKPIDAAGKLPSGESFTSPAELKAVLLKRKAEFTRTLSRKLLGYALGRGLNRFDECIVGEAIAALDANGHRSTALIEAVVLSYPFRHRYWKH